LFISGWERGLAARAPSLRVVYLQSYRFMHRPHLASSENEYGKKYISVVCIRLPDKSIIC